MQPQDPVQTDPTNPPPSPAQGAASEPGAAPTESAPSLEERLAEAERRAAEFYDQFLRAKAEGENIRRRAQEDVTRAHKYAVENFATALLPVKDSLEAALATENATIDALKSGVELTLKQLESVFEKASVREVNPAGEKFDPHKHQAISTLPSEKEPNTVINVLQKGYLLNDRVIRPALVTVARDKES
jgi:molecular chaperone GrpE